MKMQPRSDAEKPVRPIEVSAQSRAQDSCAPAVMGESDVEVAEYWDEEHTENGSTEPNKLQDPKLPTEEEIKSMHSPTCFIGHGARTVCAARGDPESISR